MNSYALRLVMVLLTAGLAVGQQAPPHSSGGITGFVLHPDGTPSAGAVVSAVTECEGMGYRLEQEVKTSADGSFHVPPFLREATCTRVRLSAENIDDLWLKTGHDVFDGMDNGTTPVLEVPPFGSPATTEIRLGSRGGLVSFRVWDAATSSFVWAELDLERMDGPSAKFGSMTIATGNDGSADTLLLPAGRYRISVEGYSCKGARYIPASQLCKTLTVEAGARTTQDISIDVRRIKPLKSYSNPHGRPCNP